VLPGFFETPWERPVAGLADAARALVLNSAGFRLRALGRLQEAAQPMRAGLQARIALEDWKNAAVAANNLSELYLTIGDMPRAVEFAREAVELSDRSGDDFQRMARRTTLADALHQCGRIQKAAEAFREAEEMQKQQEPDCPFLYSLQGFQYCDLLLSQGQIQQVKERAAQALEISGRNNWLLDIGLDNLSLGRASPMETEQPGASDNVQAAEFLQRAVDGLRQAGTQEHLPRGLLARAALHRVTGDYARAQRDLDEAFRIANRGGMALHIADYQLESARLYLAQGVRDNAREHLATAREMIQRIGYHRRDSELEDLERALL
jgi:tetratricopeptide (TPR) repeat protein